jgi:Uma2 family endonuclease
MSTSALVSVEEYLRHAGKPNREYRDGVISEKPMPTTFHGLLEFMLVLLLRRLGVEAAPEVTIRLSPTRFLIPDVIAAPVLQHPYPQEPVLLCCEILSPDDRLGGVFSKCEEYHAWGVPYCWVFDPMKRTAWEYHSGSDPIRAGGDIHAGRLSVSVDELFSAIDPGPETAPR